MTLGIILECTLCALLFGVLIYSIVLNRHLSVLKLGREDLKKLMDTFTEAVDRASASIQSLKKTTAEGDNLLGAKIKAAEGMCEELEFLIGRSEALVNELNTMITHGEVRGARETTPVFKCPEPLPVAPPAEITSEDHAKHKIFKTLQNLR